MNVATWSAKIIERPDGLILRSDQTHLPDCNHVLRMLVKHREIRMLSRGAYARCSTIDELPPWGRFDLEARSVGSTRGRILAGYSAAAVHGLWRYQSVPGRHHIYRRSQGRRLTTGPRLTELHSRLLPEDTVMVDGLWCTSVDRTIADLVRVHGFGAGFVALCHALRLGLTSRENFGRFLGGEESSGDLRTLVNRATPAVESAMEAQFLAQSVFYGDFDLIPQYAVTVEDGTVYRVDFVVEGTIEGIELDGRGKYGSTDGEQHFSLEREKRRADAIRRAGVTTAHYSYHQVEKLHAYRATLARLGLPDRTEFPRIHID